MFTCVIAIRTQSYSQYGVCRSFGVTLCSWVLYFLSFTPKTAKANRYCLSSLVVIVFFLMRNQIALPNKRTKEMWNWIGDDVVPKSKQTAEKRYVFGICIPWLKRNLFAVRCGNSSSGNAPFRFDRFSFTKMTFCNWSVWPLRKKRKQNPLCAHVIIVEIRQCCVFVLVYHNYSGHAKSVYKSFTWNHVHRP